MDTQEIGTDPATGPKRRPWLLRIAFLLPCALGVVMLLSALSSPHETAAVVRGGQTYHGQIVQWRLGADGTVAFQLAASKPKQAKLWFRSPANKTSTTRLEDLLLRVVLDASASKSKYDLAVQSESDAANDGDTPEKAIDLAWIGRL